MWLEFRRVLFRSESCLVVSYSLQPHGLYTVHGILQARIVDWVAFPFSRGSFPTQGLNPGLPHCGRILYQLSHFTKRYIIYSIYSYNQLIHMNNSSTLRILRKYIHNFLQNYLKINTSVIQVLLAWNLIDLIIANTGIFVQVWRRTLMEILFKCD